MRENEVISELKEFLRRYRVYKGKSNNYLGVDMTVFVREREAIAYALDVLERLNSAKLKENTYPDNIYAKLGFDMSHNLTDKQLNGFDYIKSHVLSQLEVDILEAKYRDKKKNQEIADSLGISRKTLGKRISNIIDKLKTPDYLEILSGRTLSIDVGQDVRTNHKEYAELYNRRIKAVAELRKEVENLEAVVDIIHEKRDTVGVDECKRLAEEAIEDNLHINISDLDLSTRAYNILIRNGVSYVSDLMSWSYDGIMKLRNCGKKTAEEILSKAAKYGIIMEPNTEPGH